MTTHSPEQSGDGATETVRILPAGDAAVLIELGDRIDPSIARRVQAVAEDLRAHLSAGGAVEVVAGYASVLISWEAGGDVPDALSQSIAEAVNGTPERAFAARRFTLPVVYGGEYGPDLDDVAAAHGLTRDQVTAIHSERDYCIYCLGFAPGFPYLGGLDLRLHTDRLDRPRARVPAGSVAIGGAQTGVYPVALPGGWRIIGRTPLVLFDPEQSPPIPYAPGDVIRFEAVSESEFVELKSRRVMPRAEALDAGEL